jgi:hypothetical protein
MIRMEKYPGAPDIDAPPTTPAPDPARPHVNRMNHQLYNILRTNNQPTEEQKAAYEELDKRRTGGPSNPLTIMKPLKPSPLDDYDKAVKRRRTKARGGEKFVEVRS